VVVVVAVAVEESRVVVVGVAEKESLALILVTALENLVQVVP